LICHKIWFIRRNGVVTMSELGDECDDRGGVLGVALGELRDAVGAGKLGKFVMQRIAVDLAGHGLGYFPPSVLDANDQPRQDQRLRIYRKGTGVVARVIDAVLHPSEAGDEFLNGLGTNDAEEKVARIRELVCADM
jgi:hypothetical protein